MTVRSIDVDRVVREVLAELGAAPHLGGRGSLSACGSGGRGSLSAPEPATAPGAPGGLSESGNGDSGNEALADKPPAAPMTAAPAGELVLNCRVVTLSEVDGRLGAVRRLVVPPGAVITPAVRDELSRRNVTLAYAPPVAAPAATSLRLVVVTLGKQPDAAPLLGGLASEGIEVAQHRLDCLIAATDLLAGELAKPHTLGLLLTRHIAAGLCLANRLRGVRAVSGTDTGTVAAAASAVGANLLIVDAAAAGPFRLRQIVSEFCRGGTPPCPEVFKERLA
jgi:hypothetical protein